MKNIYPLFLIMLLCSATAMAQPWPLMGQLNATDKQGDDNNAYSVDIDGDWAVTGAYRHDLDGSGGNSMNNSGAAYVFKYDSSSKTWSQQAKLLAADRSVTAFFGYDVAISGSYIIVGAPQDSASCGAAYVYERDSTNTWVQKKKLVATSRRASDRFGTSVAITSNGEWALVGAHHEDEDVNDMNALNNAGSAFFFYRNMGAWDSVQKVTAFDRSVNSEFGIDVGIDGQRAIVGSYRHDKDTTGIEKGAAYVFAFTSGSWNYVRTLEASDRTRDDEYGWSVDVDGNYYIVGAPKQDADETGTNVKVNSGAAYIYDESASWAEVKVVNSDRADQDNFGQSVSISGTRAVVGAPLQNAGALNATPPSMKSNAGAAYVYRRVSASVWTQEKKLVADESDRFADDKLGFSVGIDGDRAIAGAPENNYDQNPTAPSIGTGYVFTKDSMTSVYEYDLTSSMSVYPNPTSGDVHISFTEKVNDLQVNVYNIQGQLLLSQSYKQSSSARINIAAQPTGVYVISVLFNGNHNKHIRLVKQ